MNSNKKKNIFFAGLAAFALLAAGGAGVAINHGFNVNPIVARAEEKTSSMVFSAECGGKGTADDGAVWAVTSDAAEQAIDGTKGLHYGSNSKAVQYLHLSTSDITDKVTRVAVKATDSKGGALTVKVGGVAFECNENESATLTSTNTEYVFEGEGTGEIVVAIDRTTAVSKAMYLKSIVVTYDDAPAADLDSITVTTPPTKTRYLDGESFDPTGLVVTASFVDGSEKIVNNNDLAFAPEAVTEGTEHVTASYTKGEITKSVNIPVSVVSIVEIVKVVSAPEWVYVNGTIDPSDIVLSVRYDDGVVEETVADGYEADTSAVGVIEATAMLGNLTATWSLEVREAPKSYSMVFGNQLSKGSEVATLEELKGVTGYQIDENILVSELTKVSAGEGNAVCLGSSKYTGSITLGVDPSKFVVSVDVTAARYADDEDVLSVNGEEVDLTAELTKYSFNVGLDYDEVEISSTSSAKRLYISAIDVNFTELDGEAFAEHFIAKTGEVCAAYDGHTDNGATLASKWENFKGVFARLDDEDKAALKNANADASGTAIEKAAARYDYVVRKYKTTVLEDFIGRVEDVASGNFANAKGLKENSTLPIIIISSIVTAGLAIGLTGYALKKKKKN